ncbi:MAG: M23 family metallopeptidase [Anaerovoracaceae bacterium]|nr:M23 family metallopeptidase [Anaerovoracaceae bacterium]
MRQEKKKSNMPAAALILCFCLMALISIFMVKASIDKVKNSMETADVVKKQAVEDVEKPEPQVVDSVENADVQDESNSSSEFIFPVEGEIIMEHSMDMPVYWKTLDQYMTHSGIDIASETGTAVQAFAGGTVTKIDEDDSMGVTVEINHGNGLISVYSNLAADGLIELGEVVPQGTVIGKVGQSSLFEFESPDHLHFELIKGGQPVDPLDYLK